MHKLVVGCVRQVDDTLITQMIPQKRRLTLTVNDIIVQMIAVVCYRTCVSRTEECKGVQILYLRMVADDLTQYGTII